jgi:hypothetical protein
MGKRELLLIIAFVIIGAVVYQATAPTPDPTKPGLSVGRLIEHVRREVGGNRAAIDTVSTSVIAVDDEVSELRITEFLRELHITGEDRADIGAVLKINSRAYNDAEAKQYAARTVLKVDHAASSILLRVSYPREGRHQAALTLQIPSRLRVRLETRPGKLTIAKVAGLEAENVAGETAIRQIAGRAVITNRGGRILIEDTAALKLTARGSEVSVTSVRGDTSIVMEQGGELKASKLAGPLDVDARNAEVTLEGLESTRGPIRLNIVGGSARMKGIRADTRVDGRNSELDIVMAGAAPIAIYNNGGDVRLTPPDAKYRVDAVAVEGTLGPEDLIRDLGLEYSTDAENKESRASGVVDGGGPTITIRTTRSEIEFRTGETPTRKSKW